MKTGTSGEAVVRLNDGKSIKVRMRHRGYFPSVLNAAIEESIAESIHTFLRDAGYRLEPMLANPKLLTEVLLMELDEHEANFPDIIRYSKVKNDGGLSWTIDVHLEQAVAPCVTTIDFVEVTPDD